MASNRREVWVWCEDHGHQSFTRQLLETQLGFGHKEIKFYQAPDKGCASQWVIAQYKTVERFQRAARKRLGLGFLVIIDGDKIGVAGRMRSLCGAPDTRETQDRIAILVPTWNIETWVLWLAREKHEGHDVDEKKSYKAGLLDKEKFRALCSRAVKNWSAPIPQGLTELSAITAARQELARLPQKNP